MRFRPLSKPAGPSLDAQISHAERQLAERRRSIKTDGAVLLSSLYKQMTAPASLLLAGGIGFVAGELSHCPAPPSSAPSSGRLGQREPHSRTTLSAALSLLLSAHALYKALPIAWLAKHLHSSRIRTSAALRRARRSMPTTAPDKLASSGSSDPTPPRP
ncbi:hypothetical protein ACQE3E_11130 [Methylomonas sp. MED-D]|uniref:hypothetical protein n=1 Tax=unclassified Methylomonas TaxID=2608980 RepID=UPI0028A528BC|nr:hypothetical protein [Methylomonas sp. MV1]MDT4328461.1 hypothetical protein [Methylomonas sp. MV1]